MKQIKTAKWSEKKRPKPLQLHTYNKSSSTLVEFQLQRWFKFGITFQDDHEDWCDHLSNVDIWNLRRRNFDPAVPQIQLSAPSCLTVATFHPSEFSIFAAAGHTGEIFIWNISKYLSDIQTFSKCC